MQKQFNVTASGLMILRTNYSELVPYWDIYTISALNIPPMITEE